MGVHVHGTKPRMSPNGDVSVTKQDLIVFESEESVFFYGKCQSIWYWVHAAS